MKFFKQVKNELSKFIKYLNVKIVTIIFLLLVLVIPILLDKFNDDIGYTNDVLVDGVIYNANENWFAYEYSNIYNLELAQIDTNYTNELINVYSEYLKPYIKEVANNTPVNKFDDFRANIVDSNDVIEAYMLKNEENFKLALENKDVLPFLIDDEFINYTNKERTNRYQYLENKLKIIDEIILNHDYSLFLDYSKDLINEEKIKNQEKIKFLESEIIDDIEQEVLYSKEINQLEASIKVLDIELDVLEMKRLYNGENDLNSYKYEAIVDYQRSSISLFYLEKDKLTKEEYDENIDSIQDRYDTYDDYLNGDYYRKLEKYQFKINRAIYCLENDLADTAYTFDSTRSKLNVLYDTITFVSIFAILIGSFIGLANEYTNGTIRLLMTRPISRTKLYLSKYLAGLIIIISVYLIMVIFGVILYGITYGFNDLLINNYGINGEVNYLLNYFKEMLIILFTPIYYYTVCYVISSIFKNVAISVTVPMLLIFVDSVFISLLIEYIDKNIVVYTPNFVTNLLMIINNNYVIEKLTASGVTVSLFVSFILLISYSLIYLLIGLLFFKKVDIR